MSNRPVLTYTILAYLGAWAWWLPIALTGHVVDLRAWPTHIPGLLAPALAAFVVTALTKGRAGVADLLRRVGRCAIGARWWLLALSPLACRALVLATMAVLGHKLPAWSSFGQINGFPQWGVLGTFAVIFGVNAIGEETGWRGYLQPTLQRRMSPTAAIGVVSVIWAGWHVPLFLIMTGFREFTPVTIVGWLFGLFSGAVVLGWMYNKTGSILAVAIWHASYNLVSGTVAAHGPLAATTSTLVIFAAIALLIANWRTNGTTLGRTDDVSREHLQRGTAARPGGAASK
ncbi:CPBP family intramembrane glutamic endopeptidase [Longispora urticae]